MRTLLAVLLTFVFLGCNDVKETGSPPALIIWHKEIDGHRYILVQGITKNLSGMVHDPDCPCFNRR